MEIYNFERIIVVKYFEIGADLDGNRTEYKRYKCMPYTNVRSRHIKNYVEKLNSIIVHHRGWYVKSKIIVGLENVEEYLEHLKCKLTPSPEKERDIVTVKIYLGYETIPHEPALKYGLPHFFHDMFGEDFFGEDAIGVDLRSI